MDKERLFQICTEDKRDRKWIELLPDPDKAPDILFDVYTALLEADRTIKGGKK